MIVPTRNAQTIRDKSVIINKDPTMKYELSEDVRSNLSPLALAKLETMSHTQRQRLYLGDIETLCNMERATKIQLERILILKQNWQNRAELILLKK